MLILRKTVLISIQVNFKKFKETCECLIKINMKKQCFTLF